MFTISILITCILISTVLLYLNKLSFIHLKYNKDVLNIDNITFDIDFVYTWVEGSDPYHQELIKKEGHTISYRRYANNNEIHNSLKSISCFAPWVNKIFIVIADYQEFDMRLIPKELDKKINIIKHSTIIPKKYLPHFASQVIESYLYKIPTLSEQFIYFNDDMFLGNNVKKSDFFHSNGNPYMLYDNSLDYYSNSIRYFLLKPTTRNSELRHSIYQFINTFKLSKWHHYVFYKKPIHQCYPAKKSLFIDIWKENTIKQFLEQQAKDKFRSYNQLNIFYLMYLFGLHKNTVILKKESSQLYYEIKRFSKLKNQFKSLFNKRPKLFCTNNELERSNKKIESFYKLELERYMS